MSYRKVPIEPIIYEWMITEYHLEGNTLLIFADIWELLKHYQSMGVTIDSSRLAKKYNITPSRVNAITRELASMGLLRKETVTLPGGKRTTKYYIHEDKGAISVEGITESPESPDEESTNQ